MNQGTTEAETTTETKKQTTPEAAIPGKWEDRRQGKARFGFLNLVDQREQAQIVRVIWYVKTSTMVWKPAKEKGLMA